MNKIDQVINKLKKYQNNKDYYPEDLLSQEDMWLLIDYIEELEKQYKSKIKDMVKIKEIIEDSKIKCKD